MNLHKGHNKLACFIKALSFGFICLAVVYTTYGFFRGNYLAFSGKTWESSTTPLDNLFICLASAGDLFLLILLGVGVLGIIKWAWENCEV